LEGAGRGPRAAQGRGGLRPGRARPGRGRPRADAPPHPAEHRELAPRAGHDLDPDRRHRRGGPVVPRPRRAAAGAVLGHHAQHRAAVPGHGTVDGVVARAGDLRARALVQPAGRRPARPARSQRLLTPLMRPTLVLLVRHGLTPTTGKILPGQAAGLHLAEEGQRQASVVAARIDRLPKIEAIYASQLERARETAAPIARARRPAVRIDPDLADGDVGEWTGEKLWRLARKPEWQVVQRHPSGFRFPGGESFTEM